ncbi:TonB-dependent siderophore receptor [Phenylobacterium sp. J367]|uniref:TonB-dependent receptor plug domain-containing protein n=1 Tax=Phenylobacterium sp. J367 TaxID=2898435 RepID=UPI0021507D0D|nr:TonB-dependent receptor [Phenylobacterium sp. J367]MCR5880936.1 TonB-dependent receptor [Phenylobacterium sp. J367]
MTKDEFRTLSDPQLLDPPRRRNDIANLFIQDEIALRPDLLLTLGLKLEANDYTTSEWMPNARLGWRISERQFVWGAVSRAIRNPSRIERDFSIPGLVDPGHMGSEKLIAYELGYRGRITDAASVTVTTYFHDYDDIRTNELDLSWPRPVLVGNTMEGETWGVEAWGEVQVADWWRLSLGGSILEKEFRLKPGSRDISRFEAMGADPGYWGKIRSRMDLTDRLSLDMALRVYDDLPRLAASGYVGASGYAEASLRLAWRVTDQIELAVSGQDLLHARHAEASETRRSEIPRSAFVTLRWTP